MSVIIPIQQYIALGEISGYLSGSYEANQNALKGGSISAGLSKLLFLVTESVRWAYTQNPNDPTLNATGLYLYALCGRYVNAAVNILNNQSATAPIVTGPSNQSVNVGASATFTITITSSLPTSIQWYRNGILIPGATGLSYTLNNAQLSDSTAQFSAIVTSGAGQTGSSTGVLTVTASITGFFYYNAADPNAALQANTDPFTYQVNYSITHNSPISITMPSASSPNMFLVIKVPSSESAKTTWYNDSFNSGTIVPPDAVFRSSVTFGGFTYYYTRISASLNTSQPLILS
jgi:hypothetical protein